MEVSLHQSHSQDRQDSLLSLSSEIFFLYFFFAKDHFSGILIFSWSLW